MNYNTILPPFKWFVLQNFPYIEEDFDALTNWQLFCKLGKEMNKIIEKCNLTGEQVENLTNAYNELKAYVDDYFENLDIQEEVNIKLDEMAQSGQLADLIAQYLEAQAIIGFNTCESLSQATNLANGSFARTLGRNTYNDGYGAFYKIRTRTNADVPDGYNLIALSNTENLVAERVVSQLEKDFYNLNTKKYGFMGDSYGQGFSPDGDTTSWIRLLANKLDLETVEYIATAHGGDGFSQGRPDYNYINQLNALSNDEDLTDFYVCGGYNDQGQTETNIVNGIIAFNTTFKLKFPNAKLHIGMIGWSSNSDKITKLRDVYFAYKKACQENDIDFMIGCEYSLHNYFKYFASDGVHPNQAGQNSIAIALYNCIKYGQANVSEHETLYMSGSNVGFANITIEMILSNGHVSVSQNNSGTGAFTFTNAITITGNNFVEVADLTNSLIIGTDKNDVSFVMPCIVYNGSSYSHENMQFLIRNKKLFVGCPHASGGQYTSLNVKAIQFMTFNGSFSSLEC